MSKTFLILCVLVAILMTPVAEAAVAPRITTESLKEKYASVSAGGEKLRVLIIPGHDNEFSGAVYGKEEVEYNRVVANNLYTYFKNDTHFDPILSQVNGDYIPELKEYFESEMDEIISWRQAKAKAMKKALSKGRIDPFESVAHATATTTVVNRLYGMSKWANENNIDLILHIHFNDYGSRNRNGEGEYSGFSIYVPENEFRNSIPAVSIGNQIYARLEKAFFPSDFPGEINTETSGVGAIEERDLIAIGANDSLDAPSILIEYSYIYEPLVQAEFFDQVANVMAFETYTGVSNFFNPIPYASPFPGFAWTLNREKARDITKATASFETAALQMVLKNEGLYPPLGKTRNECPLTGKFGECTELALKVYQQKYGITPATGYLGPKTREFLNLVYKR
jgi:N-acetylmuramoyl-L-alanine amidase